MDLLLESVDKQVSTLHAECSDLHCKDVCRKTQEGMQISGKEKGESW